MNKRRKKAGRPAKPAPQRRSRQIMFRATERLAAQLTRAAKWRRTSLSSMIVRRLDAGVLQESGELLHDLASALRIVGDWTADSKRAEQIKAAARIILDAHVEGRMPKDLLESRRYGPVQARVLAHAILSKAVQDEEPG